MADENAKHVQDKTDDDLSALLDQTLGEFNSPPQQKPHTTDDEIDELMASADQEAAQKAAKDFQKMLEQMVTLQEEAMKKAETAPASGDQDQMDPNDPEALAMMDALKQLMECSSNVANANSAEEFLAGLDMLRSPNSPMEPFMSMIMQTLASKEVMYPPLKEIFDNYPKYLEENSAELDAETRERYEKQLNVLGKICAEFENQSDIPEVAPETAASEPAPGPPAEGEESPNLEAAAHFETLGKLLVELQQYGYPPKELVGALPDGWQMDESGLPKVADAAAATESCSIIRASELYDNIAYLHHPSGVTVVVLRAIPESEVIEVDFGSTKKHGADRSTNKVSGKGKHGALILQTDSKLCTFKCKDGSEHVVRAGVRGILVEMNERLKTKPDLIRTAPDNQGFIAIITYGAGVRNTNGMSETLPPKRLFLREE
ncbi:unnamed protein product [Caenorhabditis sp. 36 PRJEB53466]|nr:unnamed protein product [Caenorhabditis sp. 36 PRJEB53466]